MAGNSVGCILVERLVKIIKGEGFKMNKKIGLATVFALMVGMLLAFAGSASAQSCTFANPANNGIIKGTGTVLFNVTCSQFTEVSNCTISGTSPLTAGSIAAFNLINASSNLQGNRSINATLTDTTSYEDAIDWNVGGSCRNNSGASVLTTNITLTVDNTAPTTPTSTVPQNRETDKDGSVTFTGTVTGTQTTNCFLNFTGINPGSASYAMTHSANSCTTTLTGITDGLYTWFIVASDGLNLTQTDNFGLVEKNGKVYGRAKQVASKGAAGGFNGTTIALIVTAAFLFDVAGVRTKLFKKKK